MQTAHELSHAKNRPKGMILLYNIIGAFKIVPLFCIQKFIESYVCAQKTKHNLEKKTQIFAKPNSTISLKKQCYWCFNIWISRIAEKVHRMLHQNSACKVMEMLYYTIKAFFKDLRLQDKWKTFILH